MEEQHQPALALAVHGHFYQPPRENPWTEQVPREPTAAPFHDWNARIAAEAYRPNAFARVLDDRGRVVSIVNNFEHLNFDVGPTLLSWLEERVPEVYRRVLEGDVKGGGGMAQAYFHVILPLANDRDIRTQIRWGLAEFATRFGRPAEGIWLPETAVDDRVLGILVEEGVSFTILAPGQSVEKIDPRRLYRWSHPSGDGRGVDIVFYDGDVSHSVAFELGGLSSQALLDHVEAESTAVDMVHGGLVTIATDGETFGHHHTYGDRVLAYALTEEAAARGVEVVRLAEYLRTHSERDPVDVKQSSWSCAHGVGRWALDCGCSTGGQPGWTQKWRAPLREALDVLHEAVDEVYDRRGREVMVDPWGARDAYVHVLLGRVSVDEFVRRHVSAGADRVTALTLLEAQRHSLAMYTSCGWFFNDLAGLETVQILRYAARAMDLLREIGEEPPVDRFLAVLERAESNVAAEGDGRAIWHRHVDTARVDAERTVAHLALVELLERREPGERVGAFSVEVIDHDHRDGGALVLASGQVVLTHVRTGRRTEHVYAAIHLGGLEVMGAVRPTSPDGERDGLSLTRVRDAFTGDAPVTTLLRIISEEFGPREFGLQSALPDGAEQILRSAARALADRFAAAYERLFSDHRPTLRALHAAGYELPAELRAPAELALARRLEAEVAAQAGSLDPADYAGAIAIAREARAGGYTLDTPQARATMGRLLLAATEKAVVDPSVIDPTITALGIIADLGVSPALERPQEVVADALATRPGDPHLRRLAAALGLAV